MSNEWGLEPHGPLLMGDDDFARKVREVGNKGFGVWSLGWGHAKHKVPRRPGQVGFRGCWCPGRWQKLLVSSWKGSWLFTPSLSLFVVFQANRLLVSGRACQRKSVGCLAVSSELASMGVDACVCVRACVLQAWMRVVVYPRVHRRRRRWVGCA